MFLLSYYFRRYFYKTVLLSAILLIVPAHAQEIHDPEAIINRVSETINTITDYTCIFGKRELIGDRIIREENIILKVKRPGSFYMRWTDGPNRGRVAIYIEGRNNNKMLLRPGGLLGFFTVSIDPNGKEALRENRHSITEADFISIFERFKANYMKCLTDAECSPPLVKSRDSETLKLNVKFPPGKGYYAHTGSLTIDRKTWLPTGLICYGWDNEFLEEYRFSDIKINPGLTEHNFERDW